MLNYPPLGCSVNGRPVEMPKVQRAIIQVYHQYNRFQYPAYVLDILTARHTVDINVTPDKRTVSRVGSLDSSIADFCCYSSPRFF